MQHRKVIRIGQLKATFTAPGSSSSYEVLSVKVLSDLDSDKEIFKSSATVVRAEIPISHIFFTKSFPGDEII
jgi:hypothetical protein